MTTAAVLGALGSCFFLSIKTNFLDIFSVAGIITLVYQYNRITDFAEDKVNSPTEAEANFKYKSLILVSCILIFILLAISNFLVFGLKDVLIISFTILFGCLYSFPLSPLKDVRIKKVLILKNIYPAIFWPFISITFPYIRTQSEFTLKFFLFFLNSFLLVLINEIIWDIRDIEGDSTVFVKTIPTYFNTHFSWICIHLLNLASVLLILISIFYNVAPLYWAIMLFANIAIFVWYKLEKGKISRNGSHLMMLFYILLIDLHWHK